MLSKIKITEYQFFICTIDVPNGPKFLVTKFFVYISTFLKSLQMSIFDRADNSHSLYLFFLSHKWFGNIDSNSYCEFQKKRPKYKQRKRQLHLQDFTEKFASINQF